jgi:S-adenosylmethionine-diacylglycerol 3-amino-3-carboxypropyl transferase
MAIGSERSERTAAGLLGEAVHRNRAFTRAGLLERMFTLAFSELVYPQIWEDPRADLEALAITPESRIVTIASGGCNVMSYLTANPERIFAVDLNHAHIALNKMKLVAARHLPDGEAFRRFFVDADDPANVDLYDRYIAPNLDATSRAYWESRDKFGRRRITAFARGFYKTGLLGLCIAIAHRVARMYGKDPRVMLTAKTRDEQARIYEAELAPLFERKMIRKILGNEASLYGLGIPPAQYKELLGDAPHMAEVVEQRLRKLACDFDLSDNYFAWQAFNRGYSKEPNASVPPYLESRNFEAVRSRVDRVEINHLTFTKLLQREPDCSLDRYVLLDAQDWMDDATLTELWSEITRTARPGARVIFRTAGIETILPGRVPEPILGRWSYEDALSRRLSAEDRSAIYGAFHLYVLKPE